MQVARYATELHFISLYIRIRAIMQFTSTSFSRLFVNIQLHVFVSKLKLRTYNSKN